MDLVLDSGFLDLVQVSGLSTTTIVLVVFCVLVVDENVKREKQDSIAFCQSILCSVADLIDEN